MNIIISGKEGISTGIVVELKKEVEKWKYLFYRELVRQQNEVVATLTRKNILDLKEGKNVPIFVPNYEPKEPFFIDYVVVKQAN